MSRSIVVLMIVLSMGMYGCVTSASGPTFTSQAHEPAPAGFVHAYVFRDKVLYLAQAPYIASALIAIDGSAVGHLENGGYIDVLVSAGPHSIAVYSGNYRTVREFTAASTGSGYIEVSDMTRMEGARMLAEGALGALAARENAIQAREDRRSVKQDEITGAMVAITADESWSGPQRVWAIGFPSRDDALPRLSLLSLSN